MAHKKTNPLEAWIIQTGTSKTDLARAITAQRGWPCSRQMVSRWARGEKVPGVSSRQAIAKATRGAVPVSAW